MDVNALKRLFPGKRLSATVLLVEDDLATSNLWSRTLQNLGFRVRSALSAAAFLAEMKEAEILFLDLELNGDRATPQTMLDQWVAQKQGYVCIVDHAMDKDDEEDLIVRGAYNILRKPVAIKVVQTIALRYRTAVSYRRLAKDVAHLKRWILALLLVVAATGGRDLIMKFVAWVQMY